jgi:mannosyltransferase
VDKKILLSLVLISLLALAVRLYQLDRESFWLDEAFSYWAASSSPEDILQEITNDNQPPLYYLILHYWMKSVGESDWTIRLLSAIFGVLSVPIVFQIGKQLFNDRFGLVAALFLAVSPFHIQYSQEARSYSLYFFLTSLSVLFLLLMYRKVRYASVGYILSTILLLYTHNTSVVVVAAMLAFYLMLASSWRFSRLGWASISLYLPTIYPFLIANLIVCLLYAPYLPSYITQTRAVGNHFWLPRMTLSYALETGRKLVFFPPGFYIPDKAQIALLAVPFSILLMSFLALWSREKKKIVSLSLFFLVPVGILLIVSIFRNILLLRLLIPALLPLILFWPMPMVIEKNSCSYRNVAIVAMVCMLGIFVGGSVNFVRYNSKEPWRKAAENFQKNYGSGDLVVYYSSDDEVGLMRYLPPNFYDIPRIFLDSSVGPRPKRLFSHRDSANGGILSLKSLNTDRRVWVIIRDGGIDNAHAMGAIGWLDGHYKRTKEWKLGEQMDERVEMVLYKPMHQTD